VSGPTIIPRVVPRVVIISLEDQMTLPYIEPRPQIRNLGHPSLAALTGARSRPKIIVAAFHPAAKRGALLGTMGVRVPRSGIQLRARLQFAGRAGLVVRLPQRQTGLRIDDELAGEIRAAVLHAAQASASCTRGLTQLQRDHVDHVADQLARLGRLPLFARDNGSAHCLAAARAHIDEIACDDLRR
jgi:hypothetical protein